MLGRHLAARRGRGRGLLYPSCSAGRPRRRRRPDADRRPFMCRLRGRDVTSIGSPPPVPDHTPVWGTYVWVESAEETAAKAAEAGGNVAVQPFESLDGGRMAILVDPAGAVFGIWEPGSTGVPSSSTSPGAWSMSLLHTRDPEGAAAFYRAVFGWEPEEMNPRDRGGSTLDAPPRLRGGRAAAAGPPGRGRGDGADEPPISFPTRSPSHWSVDFWVDDADATAERSAQQGGTCARPPVRRTRGRAEAGRPRRSAGRHVLGDQSARSAQLLRKPKEGESMGQPVVHFEVVGKDAKKLWDYYSNLFGWKVEAMGEGPTEYGVVSREDNVNSEGVGIGGGIGSGPRGLRRPRHLLCRGATMSRLPWQRPRSSAGPG